MSTYRAKINHDIALGSLTVLSPQPDPGEGIKYALITRSANGTLVKQGPYFDFEWTTVTATQYATLLGVFGVTSADTADVTIYVRDESYQTWVRKNGVAQRPFPGETVGWNLRPIDIVIRVTNLENAA
jgi:hypothetical protein